MKVLGKRILVEQVMTKKDSKIIRLDGSDKKDSFDVNFKVIALGPECPTEKDSIKVGDTPIFGTHTQFEGMKVLKKDDKGMVTHVIVHYDDIIGLDD